MHIEDDNDLYANAKLKWWDWIFYTLITGWNNGSRYIEIHTYQLMFNENIQLPDNWEMDYYTSSSVYWPSCFFLHKKNSTKAIYIEVHYEIYENKGSYRISINDERLKSAQLKYPEITKYGFDWAENPEKEYYRYEKFLTSEQEVTDTLNILLQCEDSFWE